LLKSPLTLILFILAIQLLGTPGNSWELLGTPGNSWELLGTPGNSWELQGLMKIFNCLRSSGNF